MKTRHLFVALVFVLLTGAPQMVLAVDSYMTAFNGLYKTTNKDIGKCTVCHAARIPALNVYGKAFALKHTGAVKPALRLIQTLDSDKDTFTNIVEIRARTFPGNRNSKPPMSPDLLAVADTASSSPAAMMNHQMFTKDFNTENCTFASTGSNTYFILEPNYQLVLEGNEGGKIVHLTITVLNETKPVDGVETRVVEERHLENGVLVELSRNYFAICEKTNSVFYFGEDVDNYVNGQIANHDGSWLAGVHNAKPGVVMPGIILLGSRYFQEVAPRVAMDRAEIVSMTAVVQTPAGEFQNCLRTKETTPLEPSVTEFKLYAPTIGIVKDGPLKLVSHGFVTK